MDLLGSHEDMFKRSFNRGDVWESPRAPFEVRSSHVCNVPVQLCRISSLPGAEPTANPIAELGSNIKVASQPGAETCGPASGFQAAYAACIAAEDWCFHLGRQWLQ